MSIFAIKIIALISMIFDHAAVMFNDYTGQTIIPYNIYLFMRSIGRIALPLYLFMIVQGFKHTRNVNNYIKRLLYMGVFVQLAYIISGFFMGNLSMAYCLNIMLTLSFCVFTLNIIKNSPHRIVSYFCRLFIISAIYICITNITPLALDYGLWAVFLAVALYFCDNNFYSCIAITLWCILYYIFNMNITIFAIFGFISALIILLYNGKRGIDDKRAFYYAYPVHLVILWALMQLYILF